LITRRLIAPLALAFAVLHAGHAGAQDASPPPKPFPSEGAAPVMGGGLGMPLASDPSQACANDYALLRGETEKRGRLIKAASERKAPPDEACKLIVNFGEAERKMIKYVEANAARCGIQPQVGDQLRAAHENTDALLQKVCRLAGQMQRQSPHGRYKSTTSATPRWRSCSASRRRRESPGRRA
jgi:hypothetical protein